MISTIPYLLSKAVALEPNKTAIVENQHSVTFAELYERALSTAEVLTQLGIKKGDRVGICMNKTIDQAIVILGVIYANAIVVPILPKLKKDNIKHIIDDSAMAAVIVDHARVDEIKNGIDNKKLKIIVGHGEVDENYPSLGYLREHHVNPINNFNCISSDTSAIIYSSGSTGRPKGIVVSHRGLFDGARIVAQYLGTLKEDKIAGVLSFNFDYGLNQLWQTIYKCATLYLHDFVFPNDFFGFIEENRITVLPLMPVIISKMYDSKLSALDDSFQNNSIRCISSSGGRLSNRMISNLSTSFPNAKIFSMYGLTEAFRSTFLPPEQINIRPDSIGIAIPDVEVYVLDEEMNICPPDKQGELVHRGACISKGYWNEPEKTSERFKQIPMFPGETVVFSGDLVKKDSDGYLYFIGRKDSMIKTYGYRVSPTEIEDEAVKYEDVIACVAFGIPNIEIGEDIVLAYTTVERKTLNEKKFLQFLKSQLPSYMIPKKLCFCNSFPTTGNEGKIDRQAVYEIFSRNES